MIKIISGVDKRWWATCIRGFLRFCSWIYTAGVSGMRYLYHRDILKRYTIGRPVICIGNIVCGGSGKTPLVSYCVNVLQGKGFRPAVLMRGYMPKKWGKWGAGPKKELSPSAFIFSDEAQLLRKALPGVPVVVNPDRVQGALDALAQEDVDIFVMDDGFQHWRVKRDMDIVTIDATNPFGYHAVLPRGFLREPLSGLKRAKAFVVTRSDLVEEKDIDDIIARLKKYSPGAVIAKAVHECMEYVDLRTGERSSLTVLNAKEAGLVSAVGNPYAFVKTVERLGVNCAFHRAFADHHIYRFKDILEIMQLVKEHDVKTLVMTEKDSEKFKVFLKDIPEDITVMMLRVEIVISEGRNELLERIKSILRP